MAYLFQCGEFFFPVIKLHVESYYSPLKLYGGKLYGGSFLLLEQKYELYLKDETIERFESWVQPIFFRGCLNFAHAYIMECFSILCSALAYRRATFAVSTNKKREDRL